MNQEFMKQKPVLPLVVTMALPMTISMLVNALYNIVDSYFVAKISENAMTALSLVFPVQNLITAVTVGFGIGINAVIAFYLGAGKEKMADQAASVGMLLNLLHGVLLMVGGWLFLPHFLALFTDEAEILGMGLEYANVVFLFAVPVAIGISYEKIFQAVGRMKVSMICMMLGFVTNILLDPLLIFGVGGLPELGIRGAAIATGIGQLMTLLGYLWFARFRPLPVRIRAKLMRPEATLVKRLYSIGVPGTLNMALPSVQISALNAILSEYSAGYVLVCGAYFKLQTFLYLTANGVVQGMRPIIGYNYGAGETKRVRQIFRTALVLIAGVMAVGTVLCLAVPGTLIGLFTENAATVAIGEKALRVICAGFLASAVPVAVSGALEGLGKGMESLLISLLRYLLLQLPIAFVLSRFLAAEGVWHSFWLTEGLAAVCALFIYRRAMQEK